MHKFVIVIRIEFDVGLLLGFTEPLFRTSCTWTHMAMVTVAVL